MRHECMACRSPHDASTERKMQAVLQGNDIGQECSMTYREVLQEVCRVVRPSLPPYELAGSIRLLVHLCSAAVSYIALAYIAPGATAVPTLPAAVKQTPWVASCGVRDMRPVPQANWLKSEGVRKGDAVAIYLPLICELPSARPPAPKQHS